MIHLIILPRMSMKLSKVRLKFFCRWKNGKKTWYTLKIYQCFKIQWRSTCRMFKGSWRYWIMQEWLWSWGNVTSPIKWSTTSDMLFAQADWKFQIIQGTTEFKLILRFYNESLQFMKRLERIAKQKKEKFQKDLLFFSNRTKIQSLVRDQTLNFGPIREKEKASMKSFKRESFYWKSCSFTRS